MAQKNGILSMENQEALASIEGLPISVRDIGETYGLSLVFKLVREYGGVRLLVPMELTEGHEMIERLGQEDAQKVFEHCRGDRIDVPRSLVSKKCRDEMVSRMQADNARQADIARACGCTDRTVRNVLKRKQLNSPKSNKNQIDMFSEE